MNENQTLREQMWDLCYGLLSAEEVAALHKQIKSDPAAARLYAEVRLEADLVASAAKIEDASVTLSVPDEGRKVQPAAKSHSSVGESPFKPGKGGHSSKKRPAYSYRAANWLAGLAASLLIGLIGYGILAPKGQPGNSPSDNFLVAEVHGPKSLQSGLTQSLRVVIHDQLGQPAPAEVSYRVSYEGNVVLEDKVHTDQSGEVRLNIAGSHIKHGAVLEVQPEAEKQTHWQESAKELPQQQRAQSQLSADGPKVVVSLAARDEPVTSDVQFEKDSYQPNDTVRFWVHSWGTFSNEPAVVAEGLKLVGEDGRELQPAEVTAKAEAGIVTGAIKLPADAREGFYELVGVDRRSGQAMYVDRIAVGASADNSNEYFRRRLDDAQRQVQSLRELDKLAKSESAEKRSEKGKAGQKLAMAQGTEPRPQAPEAPPSPSQPLPAPSAAPGGAPGAPGISRVAKSPAEPARPLAAAVQSPEDRAKNLPMADKLGVDEKIETAIKFAADAKQKDDVAPVGDALVVPIPQELAGKDLLGVVSKSSVTVATQQYKGRQEESGLQKKYAERDKTTAQPNSTAPPTEVASATAESKSDFAEKQMTNGAVFSFALPPEADGELSVTLYDQSSHPPQPVYRQMVRRASSRELKLDVATERMTAAPSQELNFKITATDQNGRVVPNYFLAARFVKAEPEVLMESGAFPAAGNLAAKDGDRGGLERRGALPGGLGGGFGGSGFGGGGGLPKNAAGKGEEKPGSLQEGKEGDKKELKQRLNHEQVQMPKKAQNGATRPGESPPLANALAAPPAGLGGPESGLGPGGGAKSNGRAILPMEGTNPFFADDPAARGEQSLPLDYSELSIADSVEAPQEVLLATSDTLVKDAVRADEVSTQAARADFQKMIGRLVLVGAAGALLLFGVLAILHRPAQAKVWVPAMAVVAGSFVVGSLWLMNGNWDHPLPGRANQTALAPSAAQRFSGVARPMGPAPKSMPEPAAMDENRMPEKFERTKESADDLPPAAEAPREEADRPPAPTPTPVAPSAVGGKPAAAIPAPVTKSEPGAKDGPQNVRSDKIPADPAPKSDETKTKVTDDRKKEKEDNELPKDGVESKKSASGALAKGAEMKAVAADKQRDQRTAAPSLFWQPNVQANEKGEADLNVPLPTEAGDYYLLVDVQGPGGVGVVQRRIPIHVPAAVPAAPALPATPAKP